jgi:hypothetical protein
VGVGEGDQAVTDGPHWVKIRLTYLKNKEGERYPYKWVGQCLCGWHCVSWAWDRSWYFDYNPDQLRIHVAEDAGPTTGGVWLMSLEHVGLYIPAAT